MYAHTKRGACTFTVSFTPDHFEVSATCGCYHPHLHLHPILSPHLSFSPHTTNTHTAAAMGANHSRTEPAEAPGLQMNDIVAANESSVDAEDDLHYRKHSVAFRHPNAKLGRLLNTNSQASEIETERGMCVMMTIRDVMM